MDTKSALPTTYYAVFGVIEPTLMALGFLTFMHGGKNSFAGQALPILPSLRHPIHPAAYVELFQLGHMYLIAALVEASVAFFIYSRLTPIKGARKQERRRRVLVLQEGTCQALLMPFAIGDIGAVAVIFYALGWETMQNVREWNVGVWSMVGLSTSLALSRWAWFVGFGRWCSSRSTESKGAEEFLKYS